jgi:hypothetical protein
MVDLDLAMLYGIQTKALNQSVKRNINRFPEDFMFQLTKEEWSLLRSQFVTTKDLSKIRTLPYAFTHNGIGMLSSVLGSETAVAMNIRIMRAFTACQQEHNEQYPEIRFIQLPHRNHDRFLIIDDTVYLLGTSLKDMALSLCAITKLMVSPEAILSLLK